MILEVCCTGVESAVTAQEAGAHRIELCTHLNSGGLTPSTGLLREVVKAVSLPVFVLIRPREGNFVYSEVEQRIMLADVETALAEGVNGIVIGALLPDGSPDLAFIERVRCSAAGVPVTFHRAFDECTTPATAATALHGIGVERVLTSGQALRAPNGLAMFSALLQLEKCPILLAGGGITPENVGVLIDAGVTEVHFSARKLVHGTIGRGIFDPSYSVVDGATVRHMRAVLDAGHGATPSVSDDGARISRAKA